MNRPLYEPLREAGAMLSSGRLTVKDRETTRIIPFVPNAPQRYLFSIVIEQAKQGRPIRIAQPKYRRAGSSTLWLYLFQCLCSLIPIRKALTVAHTKEDTLEIFAIASRPAELMGAKAQASKIMYPNGSIHQCRTGGSRGVGRGSDVQYLHLTEQAYLEMTSGMDADAMAALENTVPDSPESIIIDEGTGVGPRGVFYDTCIKAEAKKNQYSLAFLPWNVDIRNRIEPHAPIIRTEKEQQMADRYKLDDAQILWWRNKLANAPTPAHAAREFPLCLGDCFELSTGRVFFTFSREQHCLSKERCPDVFSEGWYRYRSIDWGFSSHDPFVTLWVAHSPGHPPRLTIEDSIESGCEDLIKEFGAYHRDPKTGKPKDENNHAIDALRGLIVTKRLTGWVHVYRCFYQFSASSPGNMASEIHARSGWEVPPSVFVPVEGDEESVASSIDLYMSKQSGGESYEGTVADRSQPGLIQQFRLWGIRPIEGQISPVASGIKKENESQGEVEDGIGIILELLAGKHLFMTPPVDPVAELKARIEAATPKGRGAQRRRYVHLSEEEIDALREDRERTEAELYGEAENEDVLI